MKTTIFVSAAAMAVLALGACNRETPAAESATDTGVDATATTDGAMAPADASSGGTSGGAGASTSGAATSGSASGGSSMSGSATSPSATSNTTIPAGATPTQPRSSAPNEQIAGGPVAPGTPVSPPTGGATYGPRDTKTGQ